MSRMHPRYAVAVECTMVHEGRTYVGETENLSKGGVSLMLPSAPPVGAMLDISLALVFGDASSSEPLRLKAMIVWSTPLGKAVQIGARFLAPSPDERGFLDLFLRFLDGEMAAAADDAAAPPSRPRVTPADDPGIMADEKRPDGSKPGERSSE